jgi:integrase
MPANRIKPTKPYPDFPLFAHATGRWAKKIRGRMVYFGPWNDPDGALEKYLADKDALHSGRRPEALTPETALTVEVLVNRFLNAKKSRVDTGELSPLTWDEYREAGELIARMFKKRTAVESLGPVDFARLRGRMAKDWGPHRLGKFIQIVRCFFKYAYDAGLLDKPVRFGPEFTRPSKKTLRVHRAQGGAKMFERDELKRMLDAAGVPLKAMILLGINCGFGNGDCGTLPMSALDLERGWVNYPRPKTGIARRCPLWLETIEAIKQALASRPSPRSTEFSGLVFLTLTGRSWAKKTDDNPVSKETRKLLDSLEINGHRNFYCLRHTFETIAGEAKDQIAVDHIMGHAREDMATVYRERISDERLTAVVNHVRAWLNP